MSSLAILTRPAGRNEVLAHGLYEAGWQVLALPALELRALPVTAGVLPLPQHFDLVVFVSGFAVQTYLDQLRTVAGQERWPASVPVATVGPASAKAFRESNSFCAETTLFCPAADAPSHDSEALWAVLLAQNPQLRRVLIVRGTKGRDWLAEQFEASGAFVQRHAAYHRQAAEWSPMVLQQLGELARAEAKATWLLTSGEGLAAVLSHIHAAGLQGWWRASDFVVTHPSLAKRLKLEAGSEVSGAMVKICMPTDDAILAAFVAA